MGIIECFVNVIDLGALRASVTGYVCAQRRAGSKSLCIPELP
jgi:hypothetical protein